MAAFSLPTLNLQFDPPLRDLIYSCDCNCVEVCNGIHAFDVSAEYVSGWVGGVTTSLVESTLDQFEKLWNTVGEHRGGVRVDEVGGCFSAVWQAPYDCLTYFADWRQAISEAIRGMDDPPFFNPAWMTETVVALRNAILAEKAFDRLPILADALEDAGCDNRFVLDHLRGDDDHTHMCWVLDLLSVGTK